MQVTLLHERVSMVSCIFLIVYRYSFASILLFYYVTVHNNVKKNTHINVFILKYSRLFFYVQLLMVNKVISVVYCGVAFIFVILVTGDDAEHLLCLVGSLIECTANVSMLPASCL